jgi:15-cis-phytoene synthase
MLAAQRSTGLLSLPDADQPAPSPIVRSPHTLRLVTPLATEADRAACRALIKTGSKSFYTASLLLPESIREAAYALYAFCRLSDDAVDTEARQWDAIARLRRRLDQVYSGNPQTSAADRCLADVVVRFAIPRLSFDYLMEGFEWDVEGRAYETLADLEAYGERVAGSVGAMMASLMGARSPEMAERACDLGVAMQLTNIARDVGEDAANGRLYLPRSLLRAVGVDPDQWLASPVFNLQIASVVNTLLARADTLYPRADQAIARLPASVRPAIYAARLLYAEIGQVVKANGYDSISQRAHTSPGRKAWLVGRALQKASKAMPNASLPVQDGLARPLVAAVANEPVLFPNPLKKSGGVDEDIGWILELFSDLETRQTRGQLISQVRGRP